MSNSDRPPQAGSEDSVSNEIVHKAESRPSSNEQLEENERRERINAVWKQMNSGLPAKLPRSFTNKASSTENKRSPKTPDWMIALGLAPKKTSESRDKFEKISASVHDGMSEEAKRSAAAALSAVRDAAVSGALNGKGKVEITEVRDFAGHNIEVKKLVDSDSKEAENAKASAGPPSALDNILEQIKKKQKLSVLDKTKKDWGEFKEENKGLEEELDAYKKSSNKYLDKVSFLQRADLREFERERDARLALQAKRKMDMRGMTFSLI